MSRNLKGWWMLKVGKSRNNCDHCTACRDCELLQVRKALEEACNEFIDIHNSTSDVVMSNHLIYNAARKNKIMLEDMYRKLKSIGIDC